MIFRKRRERQEQALRIRDLYRKILDETQAAFCP